MSIGPRAMTDPLNLIDNISNKSEKEVKDVCRDLARELCREHVYQGFLQRYLGFSGYVERTDGGVLGKRKLQPDGKVPFLFVEDNRYKLLSSESKYSWNLYFILLHARDMREADIEVRMLPHRTQSYLKGHQEEFEVLSTENRRLYEQLLPHGSRGRGTQMPKGPLKLAVLDHYHFCFAYWAIVHYDELLTDSGRLANRTNRSNRYTYEMTIAKGAVSIKSIKEWGVYFELVHAYFSTYFPREVEGLGSSSSGSGSSSSSVVDAEHALRMPPESEKFLRIFVDMWLERNEVTNPDHKPCPRATDEENVLAQDNFVPPMLDALHGTIIMVTHLLSRKIQVDLVTQFGSRVARPSLSCPALDALSQPIFNFLVTTFRQIKVSSHSTEFFLAVDLWLTWLLPSQSLKKAGMQQSVVDRSQLWREQLLRTYVASNFHFYSTLLILFLRKMRDTLNQGWGRQELTLRLLKRVLSAFLIPEVRSAIAEVSRMADFMWAHNNACMRGYELLHAHVKRLRLDRSRPCLLATSQHDAIYLKAELLSLGGRASTGAEDDEDFLAKLQKYAALQVAWISQQWKRERTDPPAGEWQEDRNTLALEIARVIADLENVFPEARQGWGGQGAADPAANATDADRDGLLLTAQGREQVLSGKRPCDPSKAGAYVDPLFNPQIGEYEYEFLVRWAQWLYMTYMQPYFDKDYQPPPTPEPRKHKGGHMDMRAVAKQRAPPRFNPRPYLADMRYCMFYAVLGGLVFLVWMVLACIRLVANVAVPVATP